MTTWKDLSHDERATIRKLALGYSYDLREGVLRRLAKFGLVEHGPERVTLTEAGFELYRANPPTRPGPRRKRS
jgi:Mn-dependent DtxR family transcriptional regulator